MWLFVTLGNSYFTNYADDTTPYGVGSNTEEVLFELKWITEQYFIWFDNNQIKENFFLSTPEEANIHVSGTFIKSSKFKKQLGLYFDNKLKFQAYIDDIYKRAARKLNRLAGTTSFIALTNGEL